MSGFNSKTRQCWESGVSQLPPRTQSTSDTIPLGHYPPRTLSPSVTIPLGHYPPRTLSPSDTIPLGHYPPRRLSPGTLSPSDNIPLGHYPPRTLSPSDTIPLGHYPPRTLSPSDTIPLGHYPPYWERVRRYGRTCLNEHVLEMFGGRGGNGIPPGKCVKGTYLRNLLQLTQPSGRETVIKG